MLDHQQISYQYFQQQGMSLMALYTSLFYEAETVEHKGYWQKQKRLMREELDSVAEDDVARQTMLLHRWLPLEDQLSQLRAMYEHCSGAYRSFPGRLGS